MKKFTNKIFRYEDWPTHGKVTGVCDHWGDFCDQIWWHRPFRWLFVHIDRMTNWPAGFRWWLAARLRRAACWLMREKWYVSDNWAQCPGNRVADLRQRIWEDVVTLHALHRISADQGDEWKQDDTRDDLERIDRNLSELAQAAGEAWGAHLSETGA